jgi:outer membrane protein TolC
MNQKIHPTFLLALVLIGGLAQAEPLVLTVDKAVELSLKNSLALKVEDLQVEAKQRSKDFSWNAFLPKTSAGAALSHLNQGPTNPLTGVPYPNNWIASGSFSTQLTLSLALFDGIRHTVLDYDSGIIQRETARQKLVRDTKKAFYNLLLLKENITTFEDQLETARKQYEKEKRNFETGIGSEFTMLTSQVAWENRKPGLDEMRIAEAVAELSLKQTLGIDQGTVLDLQGSFDPQAVTLDSGALVNSAVSRNSSLASIRQAIAIQKNLRKAQFNLDYLPVLGFSLTADPAFQKNPFKDSLFADVSNDWRQTNGIFSLYVSLPLEGFLPFSGTAVALANQDDAIAQTETNLLVAIQGIQVQVTGLVLQVEKSREAVKRLQLNATLAARAFQMAQKGYESGAYDLLQVEDADTKLREARLNVLAEKYSYLSGLFDLEYETNQSLTEKKDE